MPSCQKWPQPSLLAPSIPRSQPKSHMRNSKGTVNPASNWHLLEPNSHEVGRRSPTTIGCPHAVAFRLAHLGQFAHPRYFPPYSLLLPLLRRRSVMRHPKSYRWRSPSCPASLLESVQCLHPAGHPRIEDL